ncbi:MAG: endonuclease [Mailhella sp.]|nr:endonuclease [Mailhella sp.]
MSCSAPLQYVYPVSGEQHASPASNVQRVEQPSLSYPEARKLIYSDIFYDHRETLYCAAEFDEHREVTLPDGFIVSTHQKRANRAETEHIVPVENFGRTFSEWREGHPLCVHKDGKPYRGRKCAELTNEEFRRMEGDLHNLYPAIGCVNAARGNKNFAMLGESVPSAFGSCEMRIEKSRVEPPEPSRGTIARAYLYFDRQYKRFSMSRQQRQLMESWDHMYPPDAWECERNERIRAIQGNGNPFVERVCR